MKRSLRLKKNVREELGIVADDEEPIEDDGSEKDPLYKHFDNG